MCMCRPAWSRLPTGHLLPGSYRCRHVQDTLREEEALLLPSAAAAARAPECLKVSQLGPGPGLRLRLRLAVARAPECLNV